jgi:hypothetical protein
MSEVSNKKKYEPGKNTAIRLPKDYPDYAVEFLNETDMTLPEIALIGIKVLMEKKNLGVFFPYHNLTPEKKARLEGNPDLQRAIMKWVDDLVFSNKPISNLATYQDKNEQAATVESKPVIEVDDDLRNYVKDMVGDDLGFDL